MKQVFMRKNALGSANVGAEEVPAPVCGPSSVLLANRHSLISAGTESTAVNSSKRDMVAKALRSADIRQSVYDMLAQDGLRKTADRVQYEMTKWTSLGYSGAGLAVEVGQDVQGIQPGDPVAYGGQGHAEYIRAPMNLCVPVPEGVSTQEAAFVALGSIALQGVRRAEVQVGETVAVIGLGLVGQLVAQLLQAAGARVVGSDILAERLALAKKLGLEEAFPAGGNLPKDLLSYTAGIGVDRVVICASSSSKQIIDQAVAISRDRGRIVVVGAVNLDIPREAFYMKELDLVISRSYGPGRYDPRYEEQGIDYPMGYVRWTENRNMREFLRLIQVGKVDVKAMVTHEFDLDEADRGYDTLRERPNECLAVLLRYDAKAQRPSSVATASKRPDAPKPTARGNVAVIGAGAFARQFHLPNIQQSKTLNLRTLVASSAQTAKEMALRYGAQRSATDAKEIWDDPEIDAVVIMTRDKSHADLTAAALAAGKHVFCEKPLATTVEECRAVAAAAAGAQRICMTGFNRRFAPMMRTVKEVLDECRGPKMIHFRVNAGPLPHDSWAYDTAHSGGRIIGEGCHFVDLFRWLIGCEPVRVSALAAGGRPASARLEDLCANFEFADGSVASLLYTALGSPLVGKERLEAFCGGTTVVMDNYQRLTVRGIRRIDVKSRRPDKGHGLELQHFADAVTGKTTPEIDYRDGVLATLCCLKIIESARHRVPLDLDLEI